MSNRGLLVLLRQAGFKDDLPASTAAWFDSDPLLRWLGDNLGIDNFVSAEDLQQYEELQLLDEAKGMAAGGLLNLQDSDDEYGSSSEAADDDDDEDADWLYNGALEQLQTVLAARQQRCAQLQDQLQRLQHLTNQLDLALSAARQRLFQEAETTRRDAASRAAEAELSALNSSVNGGLLPVMHSVDALGKLLKESSSSWLLCAADLAEFLDQDQRLTAQFRKYRDLITARPQQELLPGSGGKGAQHQQQQRHDPLAQLLTGPLAEEQPDLGKEVLRLRWAYETGTAQHAKATADLAAVEAQVRSARQILEQGSHAAAAQEATTAKLQFEVEELQQQQTVLCAETLRPLCAAVARLQDTHITDGDYELRLLRLQHETARKKELLAALLEQGARGLLVERACTIELGKLRDMQRQMEQLLASLNGAAAAAAERGTAYAAGGSSRELQHSLRLDEDDVFLHRLHQLLKPSFADDVASASSEPLTLDALVKKWLGPELSAAATAGGSAAVVHSSRLGLQEPRTPTGNSQRAQIMPPKTGRTPSRLDTTDARSSLVAAITDISNSRDATCKQLQQLLSSEAPAVVQRARTVCVDLRDSFFLHGSPVMTGRGLQEAMTSLQAMISEQEAVHKGLADRWHQLLRDMEADQESWELQLSCLRLFHSDPLELSRRVNALRDKLRELTGQPQDEFDDDLY